MFSVLPRRFRAFSRAAQGLERLFGGLGGQGFVEDFFAASVACCGRFLYLDYSFSLRVRFWEFGFFGGFLYGDRFLYFRVCV